MPIYDINPTPFGFTAGDIEEYRLNCTKPIGQLSVLQLALLNEFLHRVSYAIREFDLPRVIKYTVNTHPQVILKQLQNYEQEEKASERRERTEYPERTNRDGAG